MNSQSANQPVRPAVGQDFIVQLVLLGLFSFLQQAAPLLLVAVSGWSSTLNGCRTKRGRKGRRRSERLLPSNSAVTRRSQWCRSIVAAITSLPRKRPSSRPSDSLEVANYGCLWRRHQRYQRQRFLNKRTPLICPSPTSRVGRARRQTSFLKQNSKRCCCRDHDCGSRSHRVLLLAHLL